MKTNFFPKSAISYGVTLISILVALGVYGYIGIFNRLMGDSLCSYYYAQRLGLFRSIWYWRNMWSGRYSAYGFDWLLSNILPAQNVPFFIPVILIIWVVSNTWAVFLLLRNISTEKNLFFISLLLGMSSVFIILSTSPYIQQSFYWIDGFRAYTLPIILLPPSFIIYSLITKGNSKLPVIAVASISFLMTFVNGGLSETFAAFQFAVLTLIIISFLFIERPVKFSKPLLALISGATGSMAALAIIITAPGNTVRQQFFPSPPGVIELISISLESYISFWHTILATPEKILGLFGGILLSLWVGGAIHIDGNFRDHGKKIFASIFLAISSSFACFPPGVYGYSEETPQRVLIIAAFTQTVFLMSAGFWTGNLTKRYISQGWMNVLLIVIPLLLLSSTFMVSRDLYQSRDIYIAYAENWDKTDMVIKAAKAEGKEVITVKNAPNWAGMDLLNTNPKHWVNECYSYYYGIQVFGE